MRLFLHLKGVSNYQSKCCLFQIADDKYPISNLPSQFSSQWKDGGESPLRKASIYKKSWIKSRRRSHTHCGWADRNSHPHRFSSLQCQASPSNRPAAHPFGFLNDFHGAFSVRGRCLRVIGSKRRLLCEVWAQNIPPPRYSNHHLPVKGCFFTATFRTCVHGAWYWMVLDAFIQEFIEPSNSPIHSHYCPTHYFPDEEMMTLRNSLVKVTLISGTADSEPSQMAGPMLWALCSALPVQSKMGDSHISHLVPS